MTARPSFADATARLRKTPDASRPATCPPETVAAFIEMAVSAPMQPPPKVKKERTPGRKAGIWDTMTPEQRSAHGKYLASLRDPKRMARTIRRNGTPDGWTHDAVAAAKVKARLEAEALTAKLVASGVIDPDDKLGARATVEALVRVRSPSGYRERKLREARRLLRHYHPNLEATGLI